MTDGQTDDRAALKARFSGFTNGQLLTPPPVPDGRAHTTVTDTLTPNEPVMRKGYDDIKLKIRRNQARTFFGNVRFSVHFIAELSPDARDAVKYYRFGKTILFQKPLELRLSLNFFVALWRAFWLWLTRSQWRITVNDLVRGRTVVCKNILQVLQTEEDIRDAADVFADVLRAASWFGGEEIIQL